MHIGDVVAFNEILRREAEEKDSEAEVAAIRRERDRMRIHSSQRCWECGFKNQTRAQGYWMNASSSGSLPLSMYDL